MEIRKIYHQIMQREDFNPSFLGIFVNPFFFARRGLYKHISALSEIININGEQKRLLDLGCGSKPYEHLFRVKQYDGLEYAPAAGERTKNANYTYDGHKFPFDNEEYDVLISNEVFEHIFNLEEILGEINRVVKMGGELLITVPFVWDEHEQPYDFARYSSYGLTFLLEKYGFEVVEFNKSNNSLAVVFQLFNDYIYKKLIRRGRRINRFFVNFLCAINNIIGLIACLITPKNNDLYLDNIVLAKKVKQV